MSLLLISSLAGTGLLLFIGFLIASSLRRVVPTNEVHIVQSSKRTTSYGKDTNNGNTYYQYPSWLPFFGITRSIFPVSNFDVDLKSYEAYDKGRLPFVVDVKAFFRIEKSDIAAQRVSSFEELHSQLSAIVQGAIRTILASNEIEEIMQGRSKFGEEFTKEVSAQLANWGVETVKNIELMDIRDHKDSRVIANIMEKKKSHIEMESRTEVAKNQKMAKMAEIEANKEVELQSQSASQEVGLRTTQNERQVALANQERVQVLKDQEKITKEKEMSILSIQHVRTAEINKEVALVKAEQDKRLAIINAEASKEQSVITSAGQLASTENLAKGIALEGKAKADAQEAMLLAPVNAQTTLAKEIGSNESYQKYLITIERVKADQAIGIAQAGALKEADIKIISNSGKPTEGLKNVMELFSSSGGTELGGMLEGLGQTELGQKLLTKVLGETKQ